MEIFRFQQNVSRFGAGNRLISSTFANAPSVQRKCIYACRRWTLWEYCPSLPSTSAQKNITQIIKVSATTATTSTIGGVAGFINDGPASRFWRNLSRGRNRNICHSGNNVYSRQGSFVCKRHNWLVYLADSPKETNPCNLSSHVPFGIRLAIDKRQRRQF